MIMSDQPQVHLFEWVETILIHTTSLSSDALDRCTPARLTVVHTTYFIMQQCAVPGGSCCLVMRCRRFSHVGWRWQRCGWLTGAPRQSLFCLDFPTPTYVYLHER